MNIGNRHADDPFFRYKMPIVVLKVEGRGNGVRTLIVNLDDIAAALARPADVLLRYMACSVGTGSGVKTSHYLCGLHDRATVTGLIQSFVDEFVLCVACGNPETKCSVHKDGITLRCRACGASTRPKVSNDRLLKAFRCPSG